MKSRRVKGSLAALLCGFLYGVIPLIMLGISRTGEVPGTVCSMYRLFFAGVFTLPFALIRLRKAPLLPRQLFSVCLVGLAGGATSVLLYEAFARIPSGIGMSVHYIYPLFTLALAVLLFKEKVSRASLPAALLVLIGVVCLCDSSALPERPVPGLLLAFASAIGCSVNYMLMEHLDMGDCDKLVFTSFMNLSGALLMLVYNVATGKFTARFSVSRWALLALAGLFMIGAVIMVAVAVRNVGTVKTTVMGTLEPIVCTVGSALLLKDPVTPRTLIGSALILSAVILTTVAQNRRERVPA